MPEDYFGENVAARYDASIGRWGDPDVIDPAVDFLVEAADGGAALELGIGTGRIALPLIARGVPVHGIDMSEAMVARLRAKPGGAEIPVTMGDFSTTRVEGSFSVVYLVFNTIMNLTTQDAQVACFLNAAAHLREGGCFVVEVGMPQLQRLPPGQTIHPFFFDEPDAVRLRRVRHRRPGARLPPLRRAGRDLRPLVDPVPLRVAIRARSDGPARRAPGS